MQPATSLILYEMSHIKYLCQLSSPVFGTFLHLICQVPGCKEALRLLPSSVFLSAASFFLHFHESYCVTQLVLYMRIV